MEHKNLKQDGGRGDEDSRESTRMDVVDSRDLFRGRHELQIRHEGEVYRLRVTRNGRLILNK